MAVKKNKIIIDLGEINLTDKQRKSLHTVIHDAVSKELKKAEKPVPKKPKAGVPAKALAAVVTGKVVTLHVDFNTVELGNSTITASHNGDTKTLDQSGSMSFDNVIVGETIDIVDGDSNGTTTITINTHANPTQMNFAEGQHLNGFFFILP